MERQEFSSLLVEASSSSSSGEAGMMTNLLIPEIFPSHELRNQNLSTSQLACVSFAALPSLASIGRSSPPAVSCLGVNCTCSSPPPSLNSLFPSPFSSSSLSAYFPAHVAQQCSAGVSPCGSSSPSPVSTSPFIWSRPRKLESDVKTGASLSPGVVRLSSFASLASSVQRFSHTGKVFVARPRDRDKEERCNVIGESVHHDEDGTLVAPRILAANSECSRDVTTLFQHLPLESQGTRRHKFGLAAKRRGIDSFKSGDSGGNVNSSEKDETVKVGKSKTLQTTQHLLAGAIAAMVSRTIVAPLERLKLEYLVRGAQGSVPSTVRNILATEGIKGFWKGNGVNLLRTAPFKSVNFFCFDTYRSYLLKYGKRKEITNLERLAAGAAAGVTATILCFPLDTIRTTMVAPGGEALGGMVGCFQHMLRTEGFLSLYKGLLPAVVSMAPSGAVFYGVYDMLKMSYLNSPEGKAMCRARRKRMKEMKERGEETWVQPELGPVRTLLFGAIAGACAESVTYPFEVVRRAQQLQHTAVKLGISGTVHGLLQKGGIKALYAGLFPSTLQVLPSAAFSYFVYETMKISFKIP